ncbi:MAG: RT0821/Lpp0805 family surface protein [Candidatus Thiodiazotropha sp. 4PDIVS1]
MVAYWKKTLVLILLFTFAASAVAVGFRMAEIMPAKYFTEEDWALAKQTVNNALEQGKSDETFSWKNDSTGHKGLYRVLNSLEVDERQCRDLLVLHEAGQAKAKGEYRFCKIESGEWKTIGKVPENRDR